MTDSSLQAIGEAFGGRNHATVLHACKRVTERMDVDQQAVDEVEELTNIIDRGRADRRFLTDLPVLRTRQYSRSLRPFQQLSTLQQTPMTSKSI